MTTFSGQTNQAQTNHNVTKRLKMVSLFIAVVFAFTIHPNKAQAQVIDTLEINVPFHFYAANTELPPGNYSIHVLANSNLKFMQITSADGATSAVVEIREADVSSAPKESEVTFNKYGDHYFLAKMFDEGNPSGDEVVESNYEKTVSKAAAESQVHLATQNRRQPAD
jgi:hypothetical protein